MKFDWAEAWKSMIPIAVFVAGLFVINLVVKATIRIEDCTGFQSLVIIALLLIAVYFVLFGLAVW